ncbi:uncharacterized protein SAPINGB_P004790 [Magnusiomyces paraingens]|uniref:SP-RING-type domain-containing protein n=1 Tax=Magnusiomyces paraingens TaxID=2606893 RepID=A0A5E8BWR1_9ASCO|nr:uncharacterized protein SAPINGB_P004790 [Saprochaete ingens]VVT56079.1 unnamed protein product [Saprochaete ingens]
MSYFLGEKAFPLPQTSLNQFKGRANRHISGDIAEVSNEINNIQKLFTNVADKLENLREPYSENDFQYTDDDIEDLSVSEKARREQRAYNIDTALQTIFSNYRALIDLNARNKILSNATSIAAESYRPPPNFEKIDENNISSMQTDNLAYILDQKYNQLVNEYNSKSQSERYNDTASNYVSMREHIWSINHSKAMPNINREYSDYDEDEDDDLVVEETVQSYKCPLTKQYYENPVRSRVCGHSFSSAAIYEILNNSYFHSDKILCPIPACSHHFSRNDLEPNPQLDRETKAAKRREQLEQEKEDRNIDRL